MRLDTGALVFGVFLYMFRGLFWVIRFEDRMLRWCYGLGCRCFFVRRGFSVGFDSLGCILGFFECFREKCRFGGFCSIKRFRIFGGTFGVSFSFKKFFF